MTEKKQLGRPEEVKDGKTKNVLLSGEQFAWCKATGNISKAVRDAVDLAMAADEKEN